MQVREIVPLEIQLIIPLLKMYKKMYKEFGFDVELGNLLASNKR